MTSQETAVSAAAALERAYAQREHYAAASDRPVVGVFGNGMPETIIAASGAVPVHVSLGSASATHPIAEIIEPFVDEEVRNFLVRLMQGEFAGLAGIIFSRDDAPALVAYQYASEWIRQDRERGPTPPLFLWNLVHADTKPVADFNRIQADKLFDFLETIGLSRPTESSLADAAAEEAERAEALDKMQSAVGAGLNGRTAAIWRNAGRFMSANEHASLVTSALAMPPADVSTATRIGIVGSPLASATAYAMIEQFGAVVSDQQGFGEVWPGPGNARTSIDDILAATAADPSCHRIAPTSAYRAALVKNLLEAKCNLVLCQLAQTDDTFGWEIPALFSELSAHGITCINLGFRDAEPDASWLERSSRLIAEALEADK